MEKVIFMHHCRRVKQYLKDGIVHETECGFIWHSGKKADQCPRCGQWHIAMGTVLVGTNENR